MAAAERPAIIVVEVEAALRGVAASLPDAAVATAALATPLARYGDALRLGLEVTGTLRRWCERVQPTQLAELLVALTREASTLKIPRQMPADADLDDLAFTVRWRDEMESVRLALRRIGLPRFSSLESPDGKAFAQALARLDTQLGVLLSRLDITELLGDRAAIDARWADEFVGTSGAESPTAKLAGAIATTEEAFDMADTSDDAMAPLLAAMAPSDGVTANYVRRGALNRYVESAAAANPEFAQFLGAAIASLAGAGETVSEVARSWQKRRHAAATTSDATE